MGRSFTTAEGPRTVLRDVTLTVSPGEVLAVIQELATTGITLAIVTHEIGFAREVADIVAFMDDGVIVESGDPQSVIDDPQSPRLRDFLDSVL